MKHGHTQDIIKGVEKRRKERGEKGQKRKGDRGKEGKKKEGEEEERGGEEERKIMESGKGRNESRKGG